MGFKFNLKAKSNNRFAVRMRSYSKADKEAAGRPNSPYIEKTLPENEWGRYGFQLTMTYQEASNHIKTLNSLSKQRDILERKARFKELESEEKKNLLESAYLPQHIVKAFETKLENDSYATDFRKSKTFFHWKTALKVISTLDLSPSEWADNKRLILKKLEGYAPSTVSKLLSLINGYGTFYAKKMSIFFEKITWPKGPEVGRISDKYLDKTGGRTKEAKGVDLIVMEKLKLSEHLTQEEKNWCIVSLGFGLRPSETDMIADRNTDTLIIEDHTVKIYQPKLVNLPRSQRFKEVIVSHPFQQAALNIMRSSAALKRPSKYKLQKILGREYGSYSFRKGYVDIMLSFKEDLARISMDLGHSSIDRTWKSYRKKITK